MPLTHDDLCRLSRIFVGTSALRTPQDIRINEWLKGQIEATKPSSGGAGFAYVDCGCVFCP